MDELARDLDRKLTSRSASRRLGADPVEWAL